MLSTQQQLNLLGGSDSKFPLLNSLRRGQWAKIKKEEEAKKLGRTSGRFFPEEYHLDPSQGGAGGNATLTDKQKAGVLSLRITNPGTGEKTKEFDGTDVNIAGRLVRPHDSGMIHFLDADLLESEINTITENNKFVDRLTGLLMEDESGAICRFVLPSAFYNELQSGGGGGPLSDFNGLPEHFTQYTPGSKEFSEGVAKLKSVVKKAQQHIVFDDHVMGLLKKYEDNTSGKGGGKCCC